LLLKITSLRLLAQQLSIERVSEDTKYLYVYFFKTLDVSTRNVTKLIKNYLSKIEFISDKYYAFKLIKDIPNIDIIEYVQNFLIDLQSNVFKVAL
jgi:transcription-repair coupling factor (superfamily II helicase)